MDTCAGTLLNQKALYMAAKQIRQSNNGIDRGSAFHYLFSPAEKNESFGATSSACSISSSNNCCPSPRANQRSPYSSQQITSEMHDKEKSAMLPISGVCSGASVTRDAHSVVCKARVSGSEMASATGDGHAKMKRLSKRAARAAADPVEQPRKIQATANIQTAKRQGVGRKNLAKLFEREE